MPDLVEILLLAAGLGLAGAFVLRPLRAPVEAAASGEEDVEAARLRHRIALEALRDVEADRRSGSLDDATYAAQLADAEARAAQTRGALERRDAAGTAAPPPRSPRLAAATAAVIGITLVGGALLPATGIANETVVDERLAAAEEAEVARQDRIAELRAALAADPRNPRTLSDLADAHLAGSSRDDLVRAAVALRLLIDLEPARADAYERIIGAYLRAGDFANARAAWRSYAETVNADPAELAFLDGLIALRGEDDPAAAVEAFDRFLELAPQDARAEMIRSLRDEAAGG